MRRNADIPFDAARVRAELAQSQAPRTSVDAMSELPEDGVR